MSLRNTFCNLAALLSIPLIATAAQAVTITTVRVDHVSSELAFNGAFTRTATNTINGSGLNANGTHSNSGANANNMWLSTTSNSVCCGGTEYGGVITAAANPADTAPEITWDLGARHNLASMRIWNYNEVNLTSRGVQSAALRVSNDGINYTNLGNVILNQAPGNTTVDFSQVININASARFVQLDINSNYGDVNGFVGLSEVRFDGTLTGPTQTLVTGVTATASSQLAGFGGFDRAASHVVDGSGFNLATGTHTNATDGFVWLSTGTGAAGGTPDPNPQITFDLGKIRTIGEVQIWNYNEITSSGIAFRNRGIENMTVLVSDDGVLFTSLGSTTLFAAPGTADRDYHQTLDLGVRARFVRFANLTSHGGDNGFVGLSEVRFFEVIPEPASFLLLGLAGTALLRRRSRA